jgi:hypothetical protein
MAWNNNVSEWYGSFGFRSAAQTIVHAPRRELIVFGTEESAAERTPGLDRLTAAELLTQVGYDVLPGLSHATQTFRGDSARAESHADELVDMALSDVSWRGVDVFHEEPLRLGLANAPLEFGYEVAESWGVPSGTPEVSQSTEHLTGWSANHPVEYADWRMEPADVATPEHVRPTHNAEPLLLECHVQQANPGEQT